LPAAFAGEVTAYAETLRISVNALCAVALRDYLDSRPLRCGPHATQGTGDQIAPGETSPEHRREVPLNVPKVAKGQPCPCGSRKPYGKCHGRQPAGGQP